MARPIAVIQQQIIDQKNLQTVLSDLNSPSQVAIWRLWTFIIAISINLLEQVMDIFKAVIEAIVAHSIPGTPAWLRNQVLLFQYSATTPQVVVINSDFSVGYAIVNPGLRIATRVSVKQGANNVVNVKVAKSEPPVPLSALEQTSLRAFLTRIGFAGVQTNIISSNSDRLYLQAYVYYNGQYSSTISTNVILALTNYLANLSSAVNFDGIVKVSAIEDVIQGVTGVTDVQILSVKGRLDGIPFINATDVVRIYETYAGYIIQEDTAGKTFTDSLTFFIE